MVETSKVGVVVTTSSFPSIWPSRTLHRYLTIWPGETSDDIEQTIALHEQLQPDDFGYFIFYPYPGTALFHLCRERGYLPDNYHELPATHRRSILKLPDLTQDEIELHYQRFTDLRIEAALKRMPDDTVAAARDAVVHDISRAAAHA